MAEPTRRRQRRRRVPGSPIPRTPVKKPRPKGLAPYTPDEGSKADDILTAAQAALAGLVNGEDGS
jgi:hypothetical protein